VSSPGEEPEDLDLRILLILPDVTGERLNSDLELSSGIGMTSSTQMVAPDSDHHQRMTAADYLH